MMCPQCENEPCTCESLAALREPYVRDTFIRLPDGITLDEAISSTEDHVARGRLEYLRRWLATC